MVMETQTLVIAGLVFAGAPSVVGWLLLRAVKHVDASLETLTIKVDALSKTDTEIQVAIADLRARVVSLELQMRERQ